MKKVFILGTASGCDYHRMFSRMGWGFADTMGEADLVQFTGGADVSPHLYGEFINHPSTHCHPARDMSEVRSFMEALRHGIPMAGICRGGQFLNVMCGGTMHQDSMHHATGGTHKMKVVVDGMQYRVDVSSTHHQIMRLGSGGTLVGFALEMPDDVLYLEGSSFALENVEAAFYHKERVLCYQPHPEFVGDWNKDNCDVYFKLVDELMEQ